MTARALAAAVGGALAVLAAGAAGGMVAAAVLIVWLGSELRAGYAPAPPPDLDLPDPPVQPREALSRLERISGQLAISMSDGRYYDRAVRPLLRRVAAGIVAARGGRPVPDDALFGPGLGQDRAPRLSDLNALVDRMERL